MKKNSGGFTLIEVILALAIVGMSLSILSQGIIDSSKTENVAAGYTQATLLASRKIAEIETGVQQINSPSEGDYGNSHPNFRWVIIPNQTSFTDVKEVKLSVIFTVSQKEYRFDTTRFINTSLQR